MLSRGSTHLFYICQRKIVFDVILQLTGIFFKINISCLSSVWISDMCFFKSAWRVRREILPLRDILWYDIGKNSNVLTFSEMEIMIDFLKMFQQPSTWTVCDTELNNFIVISRIWNYVSKYSSWQNPLCLFWQFHFVLCTDCQGWCFLTIVYSASMQVTLSIICM